MAVMNGVSWLPVSSHSGPMSAHMGLVLHVQQGDNSCYGEFANPANQASSTWWISKSGLIEQYVDSDVVAWAEASGNLTWNSVETEGFDSEKLTDAQVLSLARIYQWGMAHYGWPPQLSESPGVRGLGWHGMGGADWGGHFGCPGDLRKAQRAAALWLATAQPTPTPVPPPETHPMIGDQMLTRDPSSKGYWILKPDGSVWAYNGAQYYGGLNPGAPVGGGAMKIAGEVAVQIEATNTGKGYWIYSNKGGLFAFGDAQYAGHP